MLIPLSDRASDLGAEFGIIGGSGFYELLTDATEIQVHTPFGEPAAPVTIGGLGGTRVAFLPRHGRHHRFAAHRVPFRANVWAMASLGVRGLIGSCSCGSLQSDIAPGHFVVVDQLVDRTHGRADTFHDAGGPDDDFGTDGPVVHQPFAQPYDPTLRAALVTGARAQGVEVHDRGTMVVVNGPRFSTLAESTWFRQMGWSVVNMTGYPEAVLSAEAGIPYATVALVTDRDAGFDGQDAVTMDAVMAVVADNVARLRGVLVATLSSLA